MQPIKTMIRCYTSKQKHRGKEYTTRQYRINLRKEQVEKSGLDCDDEIGILAWDETQQLIKAYQEYERLTGHYTKLQTEHTKLINEHRHLKEIYKKREEQVNQLENEIRGLRNRSIIEIILEKLTKRKAIEEPK